MALKKAVKGVAKGIGSVLNQICKAALLGVGAFGIPGTSFGGLLGRGQGSFLSNLFSGKATGLKEYWGRKNTRQDSWSHGWWNCIRWSLRCYVS